MMLLSLYIKILTCLATYTTCATDLKDARNFMVNMNRKWQELESDIYYMEWQFWTNVTDNNRRNLIRISSQNSDSQNRLMGELSEYKWQDLDDIKLKRQFSWFQTLLQEKALPTSKYVELKNLLITVMEKYATSKVLNFQGDRNISSFHDLEYHFRESRDEKELSYLWSEGMGVLHDLRPHFMTINNLMNKAAVLNNFTTTSEMWTKLYEVDDIRYKIKDILDQLMPFYKELHAYVRFKLGLHYRNVTSEDGPIPAHLLGDICSSSWENIYNLVVPFPGSRKVSIDDTLKAQGYTPISMFRTAEDYMVSLNFSAFPKAFWENSIFEKPKDGRDINCEPAIFEFLNTSEMRIVSCADVDQHHFFLSYELIAATYCFYINPKLPFIYRSECIPGFCRAVGGALSSYARTMKHLRKFGLINDVVVSPEETINILFYEALRTIPPLPYTYILNIWRFDVSDGLIHPENSNCEWWQLIHTYLGLEPPENRSGRDFDAGCRAHFIVSPLFLQHFIGDLLRFDIIRSLCIESGQYEKKKKKMLHECDIYGSSKAGNKLKEVFNLGRSIPFPDILEILTNKRTLRIDSILEYFQPLVDWLKSENKRIGLFIGWTETKKECRKESIRFIV